MIPDNPLRRRLRAGETVFGARASTLAPAMVEVYGALGFDFVWLDFEHTGESALDAPVFEHLSRAAAAADTSLVVRLPNGDAELIRKVLDTGVRTVLVPRVETAAEVEAAVRASRFDYEGGGERGVSHGRSSDWGLSVDTDREDDTVLVGAMVETREAVENVEEILSVPDLGFVYLGPGDLSASYGVPGDAAHPDVRSAVETVEDACVEAGVPMGRSTATTEGGVELLESGYRLVRLGDEVSSVRQVLGDRLGDLRGRA